MVAGADDSLLLLLLWVKWFYRNSWDGNGFLIFDEDNVKFVTLNPTVGHNDRFAELRN